MEVFLLAMHCKRSHSTTTIEVISPLQYKGQIKGYNCINNSYILSTHITPFRLQDKLSETTENTNVIKENYWAAIPSSTCEEIGELVVDKGGGGDELTVPLSGTRQIWGVETWSPPRHLWSWAGPRGACISSLSPVTVVKQCYDTQWGKKCESSIYRETQW